MSNPIDAIVQVNILLSAAQVTQKNFGRGLILGSNNRYLNGDLFRIYQSAAAMLTDGFLTSDAEYKAAVAYFSQPVSPPDVMVGFAPSDVAEVATVNVVTATDNTVYNVTVNGNAYTFNSGVGATLTTIAAGLIAAVNAGTDPVLAGNQAAGQFTVTANVAGVPFTITVGPSPKINASITTPERGVDTALNNIVNLAGGTAWYALILCSRSQADIQVAAATIEALGGYIFVACNADAAVLNSASVTDVAYILKAKKYMRTAFLYSGDQVDFPDAAWVGQMLPFSPGSATWKFKTLSGIVADALTATQVNTLINKAANYYVTVAGLDLTFNGNMASSEWIDVIVGRDWIQATVQADILATLASVPKVPFTDQGISVISSVLRADLQKAVNASVLESFTIVEPKAASFTILQKEARILTGLSFTGVLAGALHKIVINGNLVP
jgi:hypothetical protein